MTRNARKLLAAAALSTLAAPGVAAANPAPAPVPVALAGKILNPPDGCMLKVYDPQTRSYWYVGNGKDLPDQASVNECKQLQAVLTARDRVNKAPQQAPHKNVSRKDWARLAVRTLYVPAVATVRAIGTAAARLTRRAAMVESV